MAKLFSIVIPVFNGQEYIQDTLDSIFAQTFKNYELIVVDGASTDNTMEILNRNSDKLKVLISEKDNGMYDALKKGFALACGDYYCYINSDDRLLPFALELVAKKFEEDNFDIVFGDVNYISTIGEVIYSYKAINFNHKVIRTLQRLPFAQQSAFWTKNIYNTKGGFDTSLKYVADSKFFFKVCLDANVKKGYINNVLGEFRLHHNSFSVASAHKMKIEGEKMRQEFGFKKNEPKRLFFELIIKSLNYKDVIKKLIYKGPKI